MVVASATGVVHGQSGPTPKNLLELQPILKGVEYESPADPAAVEACKTETVYNAQKRAVGVALRDGQGKLLRRFIDSDGNNKMDQWSYFQDGFEVYRESDLDNDRSPDECRWMNAGGTRVALVNRGKIVGWKRLSAEEASKVFVQGLVTGDLALLESVLATPAELAALGVPKAEVDQVAAAAAQRADAIRNLQKSLTGWTGKTVWNRLDGQMPRLIPADPSIGLKDDIILYENAVIFAGPPNGQPAPAKMAFLQSPELIKLGDVWKFVELPRANDPDKPVVATEGGIRSWVFRQQSGAPVSDNAELEAELKKLAEYDNANAKLQVGGDKKEIAQFHVGRIPLLRAVVKMAKTPDEQLTHDKQIVDSLAAAYQTGFYPKGLELLDSLSKSEGKLGSYAAFRRISAEFAARNDEPGSNLMANQKKWMTELKGFLETYGKSEEVPEALNQLASASEFNAEEDDARKFYEQLVRDFPTSDAGKKAAGALRRLDLVGKTLDLKGPGLTGKEVSSSQLRGKTLLVTFWSSWADPVRRDLPELLKVYQKYQSKDFEIIGVNLDNDRAELDAFLKDNPLPWPQIFEPGGIEKNRFATDFGIIALPTMILVDGQGKVVNRSIRSAAELERQLEKVITSRQPGVALDR
ncbi:MAG: thioredoxin-like domain-containing protein [Isosphaeraceae bacterium]